jgi:shikimate kinase
MLKVADPRGRLDALYAERDPLYRSIADHIVESERDTVMRFARTLAPSAEAAPLLPPGVLEGPE